MKKIKNILTGFLSIFLIFSILFFCKSLTASQENVKQKELEKYLKKAKIGPDKRQVGRRTEAYLVNLDDGKMKRGGFLRLTDFSRPHRSPDSYKYGIAAYKLDKLLDLNLVPPTVEIKYEGRKCSIQITVEEFIMEGDRKIKKMEPPDPESFYNTMEDLNVFDNLTYSYSLCKHKGGLDDILIEHKKDWKIWRIDLGEAFAPYTELISECEITRCSKKLYQNLLNLKDKVIKNKVKKYLNKDEIDALLKRKKIIIKKIKKLIAEKGEESVLFS